MNMLSTGRPQPPQPRTQGESLTIHRRRVASSSTSDVGVVRIGVDNEKTPGRCYAPGSESERKALTMNDHTHPRPDDRQARLRAAAGLLEHLADGAVPEGDEKAVEGAVRRHLKKAGVLT